MSTKNILVILSIIIAILTMGGIYQISKNGLIAHKQFAVPASKTDVSSPTITPTLAPKYSVTIVRPPVPSAHGFSFEAIVRNISVSPYITNFSFYECDFMDKNNKTYKGSVMDEKVFDKAILPGESATVTFNDVNTTIRSLERHDYTSVNETWRECAYDEKGQNICKNIEGMEITNCTAYTSSSKKQAGNGWGENPVKVDFPL